MNRIGIIHMESHLRGARRAMYLVAAAALAGVATACGSAAVTTTSSSAASSAAPTSTTQPTPSAPASTGAPAQSGSGLDACVVGKWTATSVIIGPATGSAGLVLTINSDGSSSVDFSPAAPITGPLNGHTFSSKASGMGTMHFAAINAGHASVDAQDFTKVTYTRTTDGASVPGGQQPKNLVGESLTYTCSSSALVLTDTVSATVYNFAH